MKSILRLLLIIVVLALASCQKEQAPELLNTDEAIVTSLKIYTGFPETYESGVKSTYPAGDITIATGIWNLDDAVIGTSSSDRKYGSRSVRIQNSGILTMNFDVINGCKKVTFYYAKYGSDANSTFDLYASLDGGVTWTKTGNTITASSTTLKLATFTMSVNGNIRFQLRKLSGGKLNIDNFSIEDNPLPATQENNLALGNPSNATVNVNTPNNYLVSKHDYTLSYNNSKGTANWVSWHLSSAWIGNTPRCDCFSPDASLPPSFYVVYTSAYTGSGFDRGHLCPSGDRTLNSNDNAETFLMDNITPQAPNNNQITWEIGRAHV